jgi:hypothetical protein
MRTWLVREARARGLDVARLDASHYRAAVKMQLNTTEARAQVVV